MEDTVCQPCSDDGNQNEAYGFCLDCGEYLCQDCYLNHCKPRPMRNHTLLDMDQLLKVIPIVRKKETRNVLTKLGGPDGFSEKPTSPECSIENSSSEPEREETGFLSIRASFLKDVYVRSETDQDSLCQVASMVLMSENKLILTDKRQRKVKLVDINRAKVLSELQFVSNAQIIPPVDVVKVDKNRIVVGLQDGDCMLVNVGTSFTINRLITSKSRSILSYYPDRGLYIVFDNNLSGIMEVDLFGNKRNFCRSTTQTLSSNHEFAGSLLKFYQSGMACVYTVLRIGHRQRQTSYLACVTPDGQISNTKPFADDMEDIVMDETESVMFVISGGVVHVLLVGTTDTRALWTKTEGLCRACALAYCPGSKKTVRRHE